MNTYYKTISISIVFILSISTILSTPLAQGTEHKNSSYDRNGWLSANGISAKPSKQRTWFLYKLKPGSKTQDSIELWNQRKKPIRVVIEPQDARLTNGAFSLLQERDQGLWFNKWITPMQTTLTINPQEKKTIRFWISIPNNAHQRDYWGGITARELVDQGSAWRVGVRTLIRVRKNSSSVNEYLPQAKESTLYYPELTLWFQQFSWKAFLKPFFPRAF